jgi:hypothetical protein
MDNFGVPTRGILLVIHRVENNKSANSARLYGMDFPQLSSYNEIGAFVSNILIFDQMHFILFELQYLFNHQSRGDARGTIR